MAEDGVEQTPSDLVARTEVPRRWPAISDRLARRLTTEGRIASWSVGGRVWVSAADVERWLSTRKRSATVSAGR